MTSLLNSHAMLIQNFETNLSTQKSGKTLGIAWVFMSKEELERDGLSKKIYDSSCTHVLPAKDPPFFSVAFIVS